MFMQKHTPAGGGAPLPAHNDKKTEQLKQVPTVITSISVTLGESHGSSNGHETSTVSRSWSAIIGTTRAHQPARPDETSDVGLALLGHWDV
jgi:hypothetical protein